MKPTKKKDSEMKSLTIEQRNVEIYSSAANMAEYHEKLDSLMDEVDATDERLWSAGNGKLWLNEFHFGNRLAEAAKTWKHSQGEHIRDFHERIAEWLYLNCENA